ncbi:GntR family transcriptional regulator [Streptomyces roseus]|uniref:GntR family transcriptional regulator n=1 Tax=Streptomyces roseus TaxID=66430 RepID=UPI0037AF2C0A
MGGPGISPLSPGNHVRSWSARTSTGTTAHEAEERGGGVSNPSPRGTFLTIAEVLRARIAEGAYPNGLPSEAEIGSEFGVARTTVRRALRALEKAGAVATVAGVGRQAAGGSQVAPYKQIMTDLLDRIRTGELPAGARLPSEAELAESYGVARGTVRRALHELEAAGHVQAQHGVGRFVRPAS